jgi:hypothetical protein
VEEYLHIAQDGREILRECSASVDDFIAFAQGCSQSPLSSDKAENWARDAVQAIIEKMGPTDIDVLKVATLLNALHQAGLHILEQEIDSMVRESFMQCMT